MKSKSLQPFREYILISDDDEDSDDTTSVSIEKNNDEVSTPEMLLKRQRIGLLKRPRIGSYWEISGDFVEDNKLEDMLAEGYFDNSQHVEEQ